MTLVDRPFGSLQRWRKAAIEDRRDLHPVPVGRREQSLRAFQTELERLLDDKVLAGRGCSLRHVEVQARRQAYANDVHVRPIEDRLEFCSPLGAMALGEGLRALSNKVADDNQPTAGRGRRGGGMRRTDQTGADDRKADSWYL